MRPSDDHSYEPHGAIISPFCRKCTNHRDSEWLYDNTDECIHIRGGKRTPQHMLAVPTMGVPQPIVPTHVVPHRCPHRLQALCRNPFDIRRRFLMTTYIDGARDLKKWTGVASV